ncbi:MAG TPA: HIT family protein [Candidatus Lokiarchaeia archaeon]|nr:HIT family protein [Candidatus Lokiarchaeia archaeon]
MAKKQEKSKKDAKTEVETEATGMNCIFCKILDGIIPARKFYEDDTAIAFLDINPASPGHSLVVPRHHFKTIADGTQEIIAGTFVAVKNVAELVKTRMNCDGLNIMVNQGRDAGQVIEHFHVHVVPRYKGDNIHIIPPDRKMSDEKLDEILDKLK